METNQRLALIDVLWTMHIEHLKIIGEMERSGQPRTSITQRKLELMDECRKQANGRYRDLLIKFEHELNMLEQHLRPRQSA